MLDDEMLKKFNSLPMYSSYRDCFENYDIVFEEEEHCLTISVLNYDYRESWNKHIWLTVTCYAGNCKHFELGGDRNIGRGEYIHYPNFPLMIQMFEDIKKLVSSKGYDLELKFETIMTPTK